MPQPIIVGYQPHSADRVPVAFGVAAARFTGAPLVVVAVAGGGAHARQEEAPGEHGDALDDVRRELEADGIEADVRLVRGHSAPQALHEAAQELDARMMVIGSTDRGTVGRLLPGSTATRLMHGAPCAIAVVPHGWDGGGIGTIGVAYIDTPEGHAALHSAADLARRSGASLRVLSAAKLHHMHGTFGGGDALTPAVTYEELGSAVRAAAEQAVTKAEQAEVDDTLEIDTDVSVGDPADFLIAASKHVDLLVCGSRGYGPAGAVLLGGVSRRLTSEAHCPVIVLPRGEVSS